MRKWLLVVVFLLTAAPTPARAQLGGTVIVFDPSMYQQQTQQLQQETATALSLHTGGGAGLWQSQANYLASLTNNLRHGINDPQLFAANFPGWVALPPNATQISKQVAAGALATYAGALGAAQQQAGGFQNEDSQLAAIENGNQSATAMLQAIQLNTEAQLAVAQQIQLLRQLVITQITLEATKAGEELNERAQAQATVAKSANLGVEP
jgi:conjugal transfer/entry exclusion protein